MEKVLFNDTLAEFNLIDIIKRKIAKANYMRKISSSTSCFIRTITLFFLTVILFLGSTNAQSILAKWPLNSKALPAPATPLSATNVAVGVVTNALTYNANTFGNTSPNGAGLKLKTINNYVWPVFPNPTVTTDPDFTLSFPISPAAGSDLIITGLTLVDTTPTLNGTTLAVAPYYQIDGKGAWVAFGTPQTFGGSGTVNVDFGTLNQPFFSKSADGKTHTYTVKLCFYTTTPGLATKSDYFYLTRVVFYGNVQTASTPPTVTTIQPTSSGKYAGVGTGTYSFGTTFQVPSVSGVTWNTVANPVVGTNPSTSDGNKSGSINPSALSNITGLTPNTLYHVRAYAITPLDTIYGSDLTFTTDNFSTPVVVTKTPSNVLSNKATSGGDGTIKNNLGATLIDTGGYSLTEKGIYYGTTNPPTVKLKYVNPIFGASSTTADPYDIIIKSLNPSTKYYVQAYATNKLGQSLGNVETFTTMAPVPTLTATPSVIDFGDIVNNTTAPVLSYILSGANLSPESGNITISLLPAKGFVISSSASTFPVAPVSSITIPYSGGKLRKTIYVKLLTSNFGNFKSAVGHSGGGVAAQDADSVSFLGNVIPSPDQLSNMGTDFWTGFGCEENMKTATTQFDTVTGLAKGAHFSLYIATGNQSANVVVEMPGIPNAISFPRMVTIPANSVTEVGGFPIGDGTYNNATGAADARLYTTGLSSRGIHVYSSNGVPIACWLYDWATNNSAAGAMMFPTNTWNSAYSVQAYGGTTSNTGVPSSYFFVIANDDNTVLTITPTADIIDSASSYIAAKTTGGGTILHPKGTPFTVTLAHKGDVYNAMGLVDATSGIGYDLTGTKIATDCSKRIGVFAGNSRTLINTTACNGNSSGSDNLIQQMFPKVAWGTKYLTVPTKNMEFNTFRVSVEDASTVVKVNGFPILPSKYPVLGASWNATGSFYEFASNQPLSITGDKPLSVTQFIMPGSSCGGASVGNSGTGDPEMILLSPVQQAIKSATVYCPGFKDGTSGGTYINVLIPSSGVSSFTIDGKNITSTVDTGSSSYGTAYGASNCLMSKAFVTHKGDTSYRYAMFRVSYPATHTMSSNVPFNAIAYGTSKGESWGFNAGTAINNLSSVKIAQNPNGNDTSSSVIHTCKDNPVTLQIALPYLPSQVDSIIWTAPNNTNVNLSGSINRGDIIPDPNNPLKQYADTSGSIVVGGETFYIYTCPVQYKFYDYGFYPIMATAFGKFASDCGGTDAQKIYVQVSTDNIDFKAVAAGCGSTNVTFTDNTTAMAGSSIVKWTWDFGDKTNETITNVANPNPTVNPHVYPGLNAYWAKLTTINSLGCFSIDSVYLDLAFGIKALFGKDRDTICPNSTVTFSDSSSANAATWKWDFGEPSSATNTSTAQNPTHTYTTVGKHLITLQVFTSGGCQSKVYTDSIYVSGLPKPSFTFGGVCLPGNTVFTNTSDVASGYSPYTYLWHFGEPSSLIADTSTATDGVHIYTPPVPNLGYSVKLVATNRFGCTDSISQAVSTIYQKPIAIFTADPKTCFGDLTSFVDKSTAVNQTINKWYWDFGDATSSSTQNTTHKYLTVKSFTARLAVTSDKGCGSDTATAIVKINPLPTPGFILPGSCLGSGSVTFTDTASITPDDGTQKPFTYAWNFGDASSAANVSTAQNGQHTYTAAAIYQVKQTVTSQNGCSASVTTAFDIAGSKPKPDFVVVNSSRLCSNVPVQITDTSRIDIGTIKKVEIVWDVVNNPSVIVTDNTPSNGAVGTSKTYSHTYPVLPTDKTYTIQIAAYSGSTCFDVKSQTITVHGSPKVAFANQADICASAKPIFFLLATETTGQFVGNGAFTYSGTGVNNATFTFDPSQVAGGTSGTIKALYTSKYGCVDSANSKINVLSSVDLSFSPNKLLMCKTDSTLLTPISKVGQSFTWSESNGLNTLSSTISKTPWAKPVVDSTVYTVMATNPAYCSSTASITVFASPYPTVKITNPASKIATICYGTSTTLTAKASSNNIIWSPKDSLPNGYTSASVTASVLDTTLFVVKVTDNGYCNKSVTDTVVVNVLPKFSVSVRVGSDTSTEVVPNEQIQLYAFLTDTSQHFPVKFNWTSRHSSTSYLSSTSIADPIFKASLPFTGDSVIYHVTATSLQQGCQADTDFVIRLFYKPDLLVASAFLPNSSLPQNRVLVVNPIGITHFSYFRVYNRMGQQVFSTTEIGKGWDGTISGLPADTGTYVWMAAGTDYLNKPHTQTGTVVLIR